MSNQNKWKETDELTNEGCKHFRIIMLRWAGRVKPLLHRSLEKWTGRRANTEN